MRGDRHRLLTVAVLAATAALMGAAFAAERVPPGEYADRVCGSTSEWLEEIVDLSTELGDDLSGTSDADEQKGLALDFLDAAIDGTSMWVEEIQDAGTPDVDRGKAIARGYRKGARDARDVLEDAAEEAEDLPTDDDDEFAERFEEVGTSIDEGLNQAGDALTETEQDADDEYRNALEDEPACEELREAVGAL